MGENSAIEWTDHTFNPWIGCQKVSPGCDHCYAEAFARRYGKAIWGPQGQRVRTSDTNWRKPLAWNRKAADAGKRARVFCASLADVFEDRKGLDALILWRAQLWYLIEQTPHLDWLLLTKRPENISRMVPEVWRIAGHWPYNVLVGTSVENQKQAEQRIPVLLSVPARVRFLSCEPLLKALDLSNYLVPQFAADDPRHEPWRNGIEWVIVGGESGPNARPVAPSWVRQIRDDCVAYGVPFFFKQWGEWGPKPPYYQSPEWLDVNMIRLGKFAAGRQLDGQEWNEVPVALTESA